MKFLVPGENTNARVLAKDLLEHPNHCNRALNGYQPNKNIDKLSKCDQESTNGQSLED
jgi:hypothetical protein